MTKIEAIVQPGKFENVKTALIELGIDGMANSRFRSCLSVTTALKFGLRASQLGSSREYTSMLETSHRLKCSSFPRVLSRRSR